MPDFLNSTFWYPSHCMNFGDIDIIHTWLCIFLMINSRMIDVMR